MKANRKNNNLLLIAAGALLLAIIGYLLFQNSQLQQKLTSPQPPDVVLLDQKPTEPAETANWRTYTNNDYGFSLKYPQELSLKTDDMSSRIVHYISFIFPDGCNLYRAECKKAIRVQILENPEELSLQEFYRTSSDYNIFASAEGEEITLAGFKAYKFGVDDNFARVFAYKNKIFVIQDFSRPLQKNDTFNQILSTFRFIE